jgi:hypothetical protein
LATNEPRILNESEVWKYLHGKVLLPTMFIPTSTRCRFDIPSRTFQILFLFDRRHGFPRAALLRSMLLGFLFGEAGDEIINLHQFSGGNL